MYIIRARRAEDSNQRVWTSDKRKVMNGILGNTMERPTTAVVKEAKDIIKNQLSCLRENRISRRNSHSTERTDKQRTEKNPLNIAIKKSLGN